MRGKITAFFIILQQPSVKTVMNVRIEPSWKQVLASEWEAPYFKQLTDFVRNEYMSRQVFPPGRQIFAAFDAAPFDQVKVVILGQDP